MKTSAIALWGLFMVIQLLCGLVMAAEIRVIPLQHRPAAELVPVVRGMIDQAGTVAAYENKLIVRADEETLAAVADLVKRLDTERQTLGIRVRQTLSEGHALREAHARGSLEAGDVGIGIVGTSPRRGGVMVGGAHPDDPRVQYSRRIGNMQRSSEQFVQVLDGEEAFISVGQEVPFERELSVVAGYYFGISRALDFREVTTGFLVRPRLQGDHAALEITPHMAFLDGEAEDALTFQSLVTTVRIPVGVWYNLSGNLERHDEVSQAILSIGTGEGSRDSDVWILVEK